jgi:hypothetical protein
MADEKLLREVEETKRKITCGGRAMRPDKARGGTPNRSQYPTFTDTWRKQDQDDARVRSPGCSEAFSNPNSLFLHANRHSTGYTRITIDTSGQAVKQSPNFKISGVSSRNVFPSVHTISHARGCHPIRFVFCF